MLTTAKTADPIVSMRIPHQKPRNGHDAVKIGTGRELKPRRRARRTGSA
jgi:hypothetical protein